MWNNLKTSQKQVIWHQTNPHQNKHIKHIFLHECSLGHKQSWTPNRVQNEVVVLLFSYIQPEQSFCSNLVYTDRNINDSLMGFFYQFAMEWYDWDVFSAAALHNNLRVC